MERNKTNIITTSIHSRFQHYFFANEALKLFDSIVVPILCYSAGVWGYQYTECIERVQSNFCRRVCCLNKHVPNFTALYECGRPLSVIYVTRCVKSWIKLTTLSSHRYPKQTYNMLRSLDESGRNLCHTYKTIVVSSLVSDMHG